MDVFRDPSLHDMETVLERFTYFCLAIETASVDDPPARVRHIRLGFSLKLMFTLTILSSWTPALLDLPPTVDVIRESLENILFLSDLNTDTRLLRDDDAPVGVSERTISGERLRPSDILPDLKNLPIKSPAIATPSAVSHFRTPSPLLVPSRISHDDSYWDALRRASIILPACISECHSGHFFESLKPYTGLTELALDVVDTATAKTADILPRCFTPPFIDTANPGNESISRGVVLSGIEIGAKVQGTGPVAARFNYYE